MASRALARNHRVSRAAENRLVRLGWPHFWVLGGILGGMLALVLFVFVLGLFPR